MENFKKKIIGICLILGVLMTLFPPMEIREFSRSPYDKGNSKLVSENVAYRFIGSENKTDFHISTATSFYEETSIAFDRLLLQYLVLAGAGFAIYLLIGKKE